MPNTTSNSDGISRSEDTGFVRLERILSMPMDVPLGQGEDGMQSRRTAVLDDQPLPAVLDQVLPATGVYEKAFGDVAGRPSLGLDGAIP